MLLVTHPLLLELHIDLVWLLPAALLQVTPLPPLPTPPSPLRVYSIHGPQQDQEGGVLPNRGGV